MAMDETKTTAHTDPERDILSILVNDNVGLDELLVMLETASEPSARRQLVDVIAAELTLHFEIERSYLLPLAGDGRSFGPWSSADALRQQRDVESTLNRLADADIDRIEFERARDDLATRVRRYIRVEEDELFASLRRVTTADDLNEAGRLALNAKAAAPARPPLPDRGSRDR
jgi:hypothetical protein